MDQLPALTQKLLAFRDERDWAQFHTPRNLATSISLEASELLEVFQWDREDQDGLTADKRTRIAEELADVAIYTLLLAHEAGIDLGEAIEAKLRANQERYPVDKARGRSTKYTKL